jgi:Predicted aminopeptidases
MSRLVHLLAALCLAAPAVCAAAPAITDLPAASASGSGLERVLPAAVARAARSISARRIAAHVKFLSSDLLEGRGTGTRGGATAAAYIASEFQQFGLRPAGPGGHYLQPLQFVGVTPLPDTDFELVPARGSPIRLKYGSDFVVTDETRAPTDVLDAPIVFCGYGIDAPEYNWDDFKHADLRGKVLLEFANEPSSDKAGFFDGPALTYYGRWTYKYEEAARRGAIGVLLIHRRDLAGYGWSVVENSWTGEQSFPAASPPSPLMAAGWIQWDVARLLFAASGLDIDQMLQAANQSDFRPVPLPVQLDAHLYSGIRHYQASNVLGVLPGSEPGPPRQVVVYSAHYDHLGTHPGPDGTPRIYPGAVDNATGVGVLLELARTWAMSAQRPPHPVLFAALTGEEAGLLGSRGLLANPPFPPRDITLDLNYDALIPLGLPRTVHVTGAERTNFFPEVRRIAGLLDMQIEPIRIPAPGIISVPTTSPSHVPESPPSPSPKARVSPVTTQPGASRSRAITCCTVTTSRVTPTMSAWTSAVWCAWRVSAWRSVGRPRTGSTRSTGWTIARRCRSARATDDCPCSGSSSSCWPCSPSPGRAPAFTTAPGCSAARSFSMASSAPRQSASSCWR